MVALLYCIFDEPPILFASYYFNTYFGKINLKITVNLYNINCDGIAFFAGQMKEETVLNYRLGDPTVFVPKGRFSTCGGMTVNGVNLGVMLFDDHVKYSSI